MCGLVFAFNKNNQPVNEGLIRTMNSKIVHRGPDQEGSIYRNNVGFGFRRLSILDLSDSGRQPMSSEDGNYIIVFNGEIYNYLEIKTELIGKGHSFKSSCDTEVLLKAYMQWGESCLDKLNGMWAFLIYDTRKRQVFGSRDRFGVKPLYYTSNKEYFLFASEIKSIRDSGAYKTSTNWGVVSKYFIDGRLNDNSETFYEDIFEIPAGTAFTLNREGDLSKWSYWSLNINRRNGPELNIKEAAERYSDIFEDAVKLRLRSDVPVGVFLSGGLDSTAIICSMARNWPAHIKDNPSEKRLHAFSFIDSEFDESLYIKDTISQTKAQHHILKCTANELFSALEDVLWFHDEPVHSMTALVGFKLMSLARTHGTKVVLNGQGADEVIGGYPSYTDNYWFSLLNSGHLIFAANEIMRYSKGHNMQFIGLLRRAASKTLSTNLNKMAIINSIKNRLKTQTESAHPWISEDLYGHRRPERNSKDETLQQKLLESVVTEPLPLYLRIEDRNSMANSIEARLPFMDYRLIEYSFELADNMKIHGPWNKYILRESMRNRIPESVRTRIDKMGFPTPTKRWFSGPLYDMAYDIVTSQAAKECGVFNVPEMTKDLKRHRKGEIDISQKLFGALQYIAWSSKYT